MFGVGALDAYFCDAYTDLVAATIIAKSRHDGLVLPDFFQRIRFPVSAILQSYAHNPNWRWRMAAREMMANESVLDLRTIKGLFNKFFRDGRRFFRDVIGDWIRHPDSTRRLLGITTRRFEGLSQNARRPIVAEAQRRFTKRFESIVQRRHDCIHNCDRPRVSPQPLDDAASVRSVLDDVEFIVERCDEHVNAEFREFLLGIGCPPQIVGGVGY